jgi:hypothetical protein
MLAWYDGMSVAKKNLINFPTSSASGICRPELDEQDLSWEVAEMGNKNDKTFAKINVT